MRQGDIPAEAFMFKETAACLYKKHRRLRAGTRDSDFQRSRSAEYSFAITCKAMASRHSWHTQ